MIQEALAYLTSLGIRKRPALLELADGSEEIMVYDDAKKCYERQKRFAKRKRSVSNVESLAAMVIEEAKRAGCAGEWMTVTFTKAGGSFHLNDQDARTVFEYEREVSPQWQLLTGAAGKAHGHSDFVRLLQMLRPSIPDYSSVMMTFRKVTFGQGIDIESAPTLVEGSTGMAYSVRANVRGQVTQAALPSEIRFELPYTRAAAKKYGSEIEISVDLIEAKKALTFTLLFTDRLALEEQAIADEVAWFRSTVAEKLPELSILENY